MPQEYIVVKGAREHNLKNVDVTIPRDKLVVITGVSGSGKSSLAFDTIYAEGQRRYVESLSAYARQFLGRMEKPDVEHIDGLSPAISIDQRGTTHNPRSTVGTVTEVYDYLRLLFARVGKPHCPNCGSSVQKQTVQQIVDAVRALPEGSRILLMAPKVRHRKGEHKDIIEDARKAGFVRVRIDGRVLEIDEAQGLALDKQKWHDVEVVVDRLIVGPDLELPRVADSVETSLKQGEGVLLVQVLSDAGETEPTPDAQGKSILHGLAAAQAEYQANEDGGPDEEHAPKKARANEILFSEHFACVYCGISLPEIEPRTFSFNAPYGACPECTGLGYKLEVDPDLVIQNPSLSIGQGAITPWTRAGSFSSWYLSQLESLAQANSFSMREPIRNLPQKVVDLVLYGTQGRELTVRHRTHAGRIYRWKTTFEGVIQNLERRYKETESDYVRSEIERYMAQRPCLKCNGKRLKPETLAVTVCGINIMEFCDLNIDDALAWVQRIGTGDPALVAKDKALSERDMTIGKQVLKEIGARLQFLTDIGLEYLSVGRTAMTLSGGEAQRIRLATQIGSGLTGVLYVCDEPTVGLHPVDDHRLVGTLKRLRDLGNTVIIVEHDESVMRAADWIVDLGPGAGEHGGHVVAEGPLQAILDNPNSLTGAYLSGRKKIPQPKEWRRGNGKAIIIKGCRENNLKNIDVNFPLGMMVCVSGVSGSGKSSLVYDTLYRKLAQVLYRAKDKPGEHESLEGLENLDKAVNIDQSPIGRTPRSNPATYVGAFTPIRDLFATMAEARTRGYSSGRFSFNVRGGRCEACEGDGYTQIAMQFLPDVTVPCDVCHGKRYNRETLEILFKEKSIADVLSMTVEEAFEFFSNVPSISGKLKTMRDVGLGYIRIGQPATTLSGGEAQRVKLATELSRRATGKTLYLLDEPTTGLSFEDCAALLRVLHRLVDAGNSIILIEHNLDMIKNSDWVIDLGPGPGNRGGEIVTVGTPDDIARHPTSATGIYLRPVMGLTDADVRPLPSQNGHKPRAKAIRRAPAVRTKAKTTRAKQEVGR